MNAKILLAIAGFGAVLSLGACNSSHQCCCRQGSAPTGVARSIGEATRDGRPDPLPFQLFRLENDDEDESIEMEETIVQRCDDVNCSSPAAYSPSADIPPNSVAPQDVIPVAKVPTLAFRLQMKVGNHPLRVSEVLSCGTQTFLRRVHATYYNNGWEDAVAGQHNGRYRVRVRMYYGIQSNISCFDTGVFLSLEK